MAKPVYYAKLIKRSCCELIFRAVYRLRFGRFKYLGSGVRISLLTEISNPGQIAIGSGTIIRESCHIRASERGHITFGEGCFVGPFTTLLDAGGYVEIGDRVQLGGTNFVTGQGGLHIGDAALIAPMVSIVANQHTFDDSSIPIRDQPDKSVGIRIGKNGWMGVCAVILDGVSIGDNVVIGANAVVTRDVPDKSVVAGIPARVIRTLP